MLKKVIIVGGIPSPIGGVTSYIYRLLLAFPNNYFSLIDLYPHRSKVYLDSSLNIKHEIFNGIRLSFIIYLFRKVDYVIHFNFSTFGAVPFFLLMPKRNLQKWILILHNGDPIKNLDRSCFYFIYKKIFECALKKFDRIVYLNDKQYKVYISFGVDEKKLISMDSFVPLSENEDLSVPISIDDLFIDVDFGSSIIMNGYCKSFYNFHHGVEYVLERNHSVLIIALYGDEDEAYKSELMDLIGKSDRVKIVENLDQNKFNNLMAQADIYLRANSIDSFGIAVADAVCLGIKVVASDVCKRFDGAILYNVNDRNELFGVLDDIYLLDVSKINISFNKANYLNDLAIKYSLLYEFDD
ncbi:glycosyltransferase [Oceanospirillaceae bacterium]|nr:glycosyltransferase [Oceanospirillaceae bacterium]